MIGELAASIGSGAWTLIFFVISLAIIVAVHEFGHYIVGRWSGIHAEVFSLGFGPRLISGRDRHGTLWQIAAIPLGGYVKFLGDSNAASGKDAEALSGLTDEERRHTMHGAPLWARAATVAAGPVFNFILALVILAGMIQWLGVATGVPVVGKMPAYPFDGPTLQLGDKVLAVNGQPVADLEAFNRLAVDLPAAAQVTYRVERDGAEIDVQGPHPMPPMVQGVNPTSAAMRAGLQPGDVVLTAGGQAVTAFRELPPIVEASNGAEITLQIWRAGETLTVTLAPERRDIPLADGTFETRWLFGVTGGILFEPELRRAGLWETVELSVEQAWYVGKSSLSGLWHVATGAISSCNISGPVGMAEVMGDAARSGPEVFLSMLAAMSLGIGLLNLLPIPVLDGGHLVFHVWEAVTGHPPSDRALRVLMTAGLAVVLSFMAFALTNDFFC